MHIEIDAKIKWDTLRQLTRRKENGSVENMIEDTIMQKGIVVNTVIVLFILWNDKQDKFQKSKASLHTYPNKQVFFFLEI